MKISVLSFILLFSFFNNAFAQSPGEFDYYENDRSEFTKPTDELEVKGIKNRTQFGMMTGTGLMLSSGRNTTLNTFVAPHLTYSLSPRLNLSAAAILSNNQFQSASENSFNSGSLNNQSLYLGAEYKITEHLRIGAGFQYSKGINNGSGFNNSPFNQPFSPGFSPLYGW